MYVPKFLNLYNFTYKEIENMIFNKRAVNINYLKGFIILAYLTTPYSYAEHL